MTLMDVVHGRASIRHGKWKLVNMPEHEYGTGQWQLYDLSKDQGETNDLAVDHPELVVRLMQDFTKFCAETGTVFGPPVRWDEGRKSVRPPLSIPPLMGDLVRLSR